MENIGYNENLLLLSDSYKYTHASQYPPGTEYVYSYLESRGGRYPSTTFFGLQYILKKYLVGNVVTDEKINEAEEIINMHMGRPIFNRSGWEYIVDEYNGRLPVKIMAVPEGMTIPTHNVLMTMCNTDPMCYWLTNWLETLLLQVWYPITVATQSREIRKMMDLYAENNGDPSGVPFKLHDFGFRGVSSVESAGIGGAAHAVSFQGSDTVAAITMLRKYYGAKMPLYSIPASEHSTITSWGREHEVDAMRNMLQQYPEGVIACVSDSFNIYEACENIWGGVLKDEVMKRNGTLVCRPDCYDDQTEILTPRGWKLFKNLNTDDLVAQFDNNGNIEFVQPMKYVAETYSGEMIQFSTKKHKISMLVTPNHRMVIKNTKKNVFSVTEASDAAYYYTKNLPVAGNKQGTVSNITPYERLLIAYQADGRCRLRDGQLKYSIEFQFAKQRKIDRIIAILKEGKFDYTISEPHSREFSKHNGNWNDQVSIYVHLDKQPIKHFVDWVDFTDKDANWCREFIEECSHWDATIRENDRIKFDNTNKEDAVIVQTAAILCGYRTTFTQSVDNRSDKFSDIYTVSIIKRTDIDGQCIEKESIEYSGMIYCVTVPSGMLVVRRNDQVVISGNSGNPIEIVMSCLEILDKKFGHTINNKGYKVLDPHIRIIQGDGVDQDVIQAILSAMDSEQWSIDNIAFGMGGALLQKLNRDTQKFAIKCSAIKREGKWFDVMKDPITSSAKRSKAGRMQLVRVNGVYKTVGIDEPIYNNVMEKVFYNGVLIREQNIEEIREFARV